MLTLYTIKACASLPNLAERFTRRTYAPPRTHAHTRPHEGGRNRFGTFGRFGTSSPKRAVSPR